MRKYSLVCVRCALQFREMCEIRFIAVSARTVMFLSFLNMWDIQYCCLNTISYASTGTKSRKITHISWAIPLFTLINMYYMNDEYASCLKIRLSISYFALYCNRPHSLFINCTKEATTYGKLYVYIYICLSQYCRKDLRSS
jgi:hypothetical protein